MTPQAPLGSGAGPIPCLLTIRSRVPDAPHTARKEHLMLDVIMLALGLGFFIVTVGYAYACERL